MDRHAVDEHLRSHGQGWILRAAGLGDGEVGDLHLQWGDLPSYAPARQALFIDTGIAVSRAEVQRGGGAGTHRGAAHVYLRVAALDVPEWLERPSSEASLWQFVTLRVIMNQVTQVGQFNRVAYFYASDTTTYLGRFSKDAAATVMCRLDYSGLAVPPSGPETELYSIDIGSNPPLAVSSSSYDPNGQYLDFILSGGLEGQEYNLAIAISGTVGRTDTMTIDVPLSTCDCGGSTNAGANIATYPAGYGTVFINSAIKYTISSAQPPGANIKDQWYNPDTSVLYEYITDGVSTWWQQITPTIESTAATYKLKPIVPDGATTTFSLTTVEGKSPIIGASTDLIVSVDDVIQNPDVDYKAFQNQIMFVVPPAADSIIFMTWFAHY